MHKLIANGDVSRAFALVIGGVQQPQPRPPQLLRWRRIGYSTHAHATRGCDSSAATAIHLQRVEPKWYVKCMHENTRASKDFAVWWDAQSSVVEYASSHAACPAISFPPLSTIGGAVS